jgi:predicted AAA+ superfamily ATPase
MITKNIKRSLFDTVEKHLFTGKAILILGPRQTGKTTLLNGILKTRDEKPLLLNCDDPTVREILEHASIATLRNIIGDSKLIFIDEAQRVTDIGITLKLITDEFKEVQLLVSGSSALELSNGINEPLTGRKWEYLLYPISWQELVDATTYFEAYKQLEQRILYGMYPEVVTSQHREQELLTQLASSYLYKDLLSYAGIRKPELLDKLLKALALQLGQEVSYNELAGLLQVDKNTIIQYIQLLEKAFIVMRLQPLSRNVRTEISTSRKIYFWDTGIRNTLIGNFKDLKSRTDAGALWENFLVVERLKYLQYNKIICNRFFWRTTAQQEIDYVEERDGNLFAFEFKMKVKANVRFSKTFLKGYPDAETKTITIENFHEFLTTL